MVGLLFYRLPALGHSMLQLTWNFSENRCQLLEPDFRNTGSAVYIYDANKTLESISCYLALVLWVMQRLFIVSWLVLLRLICVQNFSRRPKISSSIGWLGSRVVSMQDSSSEGPGFKSQSRRCRVTVLGTVHTHRASVHQAAKLVAALLMVARVTAGLAESNGSLPPGLWLTSPAGWMPRTGIGSGTLCSVIEYGLPFH